MFSEPCFLAGDPAGEPEGHAFFTKECIAAVAAPEGPHGRILGEVHDVFVIVAWPWDICLAGGERVSDTVEAGEPAAAAAEFFPDAAAHVGHGAHADNDVRGIGDFDTDEGERGIRWPHAEGDHVEGAALHAATELLPEFCLHFGWCHPVVGRPGFGASPGADEGAFLDAGNVRWGGAGEEATGALFRVEPDEGAAVHEEVAEGVVFSVGSIAPVDRFRLAEGGGFFDPCDDFGMCGHDW